MKGCKNFEKLYEAVIRSGTKPKKDTRAVARPAPKPTKRKKGKDFTTYNSDSRTSKMWIRPNGDILPIQMWHDQFVEWNRKEYGIKGKRTGDDARLDALDMGWFRVNYIHNSGMLVIEGKAKYFTRNIKDGIFLIVDGNLNNVDQIAITLVDDKYRAVKNASASLFMYDGREKLEHIPLVTESLKRERGLVESTTDMMKRLYGE